METVIPFVIGVVVFVIGIAASIALHEVGHLVPAKLFGVRVLRYMVGFGPTIWSRRKGETEYGIKAIPLGGYVAMSGMYPPKRPGASARDSSTGFFEAFSPSDHDVDAANEAVAKVEAADRIETIVEQTPPGVGRLQALIDDARLASAETILEGEDHRTFYRLPIYKRIIIMLGGPLMNLVLAAVCFTIVLTGFGTPQSTTTISAINECVVAADSGRDECVAGDDPSPALAAGFEPGDRLVSIDGVPIESWQQSSEIIRASADQQLTIVVERDGAEVELTATPLLTVWPVVDESGQVVTGADGEPETHQIGLLGILPGSENVRQPIGEVPVAIGDTIARVAGVVITLPQRAVDIVQALIGTEERDPNGPMSVVGVGRIAGEISSLNSVPIADRVSSLIGLLGSLNIALFVFNLIPLMPLDGGHIVGALFEGLRRWWAKVRGKPDPGPLDTARFVPITLAVAVVIGLFSALLIIADIVRPISLF